ncbi:membrane protein insertase YidC [Domibacillus enclensis]|uniref:Membrane protein insertase YidC n=1 Tax=Domibacillus enclensis TaxID=1017273 RepID=A0A1N6NMN9_9BACI|nr:membrane protein insertase YidC [Domibacillus enclensis]OXS80091.1 OxaA precursor [Domibacillus enclensis]SIP93321.1 YidC/Oxa1 family membrane protein insertase [Domibacillus enclensis]
MKKHILLGVTLISAVILSGCQSAQTEGHFFHDYLVNPFVELIHWLGELLGSYGLAIIGITIGVRLILMPLMLNSMKKQALMRQKMDVVKPQMTDIQARLKATKNPEEQRKIQMEMMSLYKDHDINPMAMGCLPMLLQIPVWTGLYYAITISEDIQTHQFLWFELGQPDIAMAIIAGIIYYIQFKVSMQTMPAEQQQQMKFIGLLSPVMILIFSFNAPAALPIYWTVSGIILIFQSWLGRKYYQNHPPAEEPAK